MSRQLSTYTQLGAFFGDAAKDQARLYVTLNYDGSNYENCAHASETVLGHPIWQLMNARNYTTFAENDNTKEQNVLSTQFAGFIEKVAQHHRTIDQVGSRSEGAYAVTIANDIYKNWGALTQDARDFYTQNINFVTAVGATDLPTQSTNVRMNLKKHDGEKTGNTVFGHCIPQLPPKTVDVTGQELGPNYLRDLYLKIVKGHSGGYQRGGSLAGIDAWKNLDVTKFLNAVYKAQMKSASRNLSVSSDLDEVYYDMADDQVYSIGAKGKLEIKGKDGVSRPVSGFAKQTGVPDSIFSCILKGDPKELSRCLGSIDDSSIYAAAEKEVRQMHPDTLNRLLATFAVETNTNGSAEHYIEWTSNLRQRLSAKMGNEKGTKTAEAILSNAKLCKYLKRVIDLQRANPALHRQDNGNLSDLPQKNLTTKSNLAYFRAPTNIDRAQALSRSLGLMVQNLNVLPQQDMLSLFRPGMQNLMYGNPFVGIAGIGGQMGGALEDVQAQSLRTIFAEIKSEMSKKGKELVQEDQDRIERAINQIEKNNKQVTRALEDLRAFSKLDNVITNGLGNSVSLSEIKNSTTIPNVRKSISNLESCVQRTSRDQVSLLTALIEQVYRPMLLVASGAQTPFMRAVHN